MTNQFLTVTNFFEQQKHCYAQNFTLEHYTKKLEYDLSSYITTQLSKQQSAFN